MTKYCDLVKFRNEAIKLSETKTTIELLDEILICTKEIEYRKNRITPQNYCHTIHEFLFYCRRINLFVDAIKYKIGIKKRILNEKK